MYVVCFFVFCFCVCCFFFFQAEDGIRDLVRSRGLGEVFKRQAQLDPTCVCVCVCVCMYVYMYVYMYVCVCVCVCCLLYISDAADE